MSEGSFGIEAFKETVLREVEARDIALAEQARDLEEQQRIAQAQLDAEKQRQEALEQQKQIEAPIAVAKAKELFKVIDSMYAFAKEKEIKTDSIVGAPELIPTSEQRWFKSKKYYPSKEIRGWIIGDIENYVHHIAHYTDDYGQPDGTSKVFHWKGFILAKDGSLVVADLESYGGIASGADGLRQYLKETPYLTDLTYQKVTPEQLTSLSDVNKLEQGLITFIVNNHLEEYLE